MCASSRSSVTSQGAGSDHPPPCEPRSDEAQVRSTVRAARNAEVRGVQPARRPRRRALSELRRTPLLHHCDRGAGALGVQQPDGMWTVGCRPHWQCERGPARIREPAAEPAGTGAKCRAAPPESTTAPPESSGVIIMGRKKPAIMQVFHMPKTPEWGMTPDVIISPTQAILRRFSGSLSRGSSVAERGIHNPEAGCSTHPPATSIHSTALPPKTGTGGGSFTGAARRPHFYRRGVVPMFGRLGPNRIESWHSVVGTLFNPTEAAAILSAPPYPAGPAGRADPPSLLLHGRPGPLLGGVR